MNRRVASLIAGTFLLAICTLLLVACGATGSSSSSNSAPPTTTATPGPGAGGSGGTSGGGSTGGGTSGGGSAGSGGSGGSGTGGSGGTGGGSSTTAALAYVGGNSAFYGIRVDSSSNISTVSGSPYSVTGNILGFATSGKLLFVSTAAAPSPNGTITAYRADDNGALTQLGTTTAQNSGGMGITADSTGKFLYGTADATPPGQSFNSPAIFGFSIDTNSGALTALPGSPYFLNGGMGPAADPVVTPNGSWVCVSMELARTNEGAQCYTRHADGSIDGNNFVSPAVSNTGIPALAVTNDSSTVLFTNGQQNQVIAALISNTRNQQTYSSGGSVASGIAVSPTGPWAVVANFSSGDLAVFQTGVGSLTPTPNHAMAGSQATEVAFSHSGTYVFVTTADGTLIYSQDKSTGALTPLNASNPAPGNGTGIGTM